MGEFAVREVLRDALSDDDAAAGAAGWGGDRFIQYENGDKTLLVLRIVADSPELAARSQDAWNKWLSHWNQGGHGAGNLVLRGDTLTLILSNDGDAANKAARDLGLG